MPQTERPAPRYREIRFCPRCGNEYRAADFKPDDFVFVCSSCTFDFYQNPLPSSVVAIAHPEHPDRLLMLRRRTSPGVGLWCVPGGFIRYGEDPAAAAGREAREESGLEVEIGPVLNVGAMYYRYRDREVFILEVAYLARPVGRLPPPGHHTAEATEMRFEPVSTVLAAPEAMAFPAQIAVYRAFQGHGSHAW